MPRTEHGACKKTKEGQCGWVRWEREDERRNGVGRQEQKVRPRWEKRKDKTKSEGRKREEEKIPRKKSGSEARISRGQTMQPWVTLKHEVCILRTRGNPPHSGNTIIYILCKDHSRDFPLKLIKHTHFSLLPFNPPPNRQ